MLKFDSHVLLCFPSMFSSICSHAQWNPLNPVTAVSKLDDGVQLTMTRGTMRLKVCSGNIIRVMLCRPLSLPSARPGRDQESWPKADWKLQTNHDGVTCKPPHLRRSVTARPE